MKLVINIPCKDEERTLPFVLKDIPQKIPGISKIEIQVVDDGSKDKTAEVAKKHGCIVLRHKYNLGLGEAFKTGVEAALERGCDIFVNTDADNQYPSKYIPDLVKPIVEEKADMVIGNRRPWKVPYFSPLKRFIQYWGNKIVRTIAGVKVPDMVSGFRAYSRDSLLKLNITTRFSYVIDTIVQASKKGVRMVSVPIKVNPPTRKSRLFKSIFEHIRKSAGNIVRMYYLYEPFKTFLILSMIFFIPGLILFIRFLINWLTKPAVGLLQSLIISAILLITSVLLFGFGIVGDSLKTNRSLIEDHIYAKRKEMYKK